jgi:NAD(P)-dependent dehydrogenase (short-subunit alcohol dehydrogenase family)
MTGGSSGIGLQLCRDLVADGHLVWVLTRSVERLATALGPGAALRLAPAAQVAAGALGSDSACGSPVDGNPAAHGQASPRPPASASIPCAAGRPSDGAPTARDLARG